MENKQLMSLILKHLQYQYDNHYGRYPMGTIIDNILNAKYETITHPEFNLKAIQEDIPREYNNLSLTDIIISDYDPLTMEIAVIGVYGTGEDTTRIDNSLYYKKKYFISEKDGN